MAKDRTFKEGLQLNLWGIGVELRMKKRRIEEGPGGTPHMKGVRMLVGNFELNP